MTRFNLLFMCAAGALVLFLSSGTVMADGGPAMISGQIDGAQPGTIPEPSLTALAAVAVGYVLLRRRKTD